MPINLTNPESSPVITTAKIKSINIDIEGSIRIEIVKGYIINGTLNELKRERLVLEGEDFVALATIIPDNSKNIYENVKSIVYSKLIEKGLISGTIV